jgi:hypothetical protein
MSHSEHREHGEPTKLEHEIERLIRELRELIELLKNQASRKAISAEGKCDTMQNASKFTFTEFDVNGKIVSIAGRLITFASDNPSAATIDGTQQVINADGSVSCPVVSLIAGPGGVANITGVDPATLGPDGNPLAAGDVDNVSAASLPAVKATGVLS